MRNLHINHCQSVKLGEAGRKIRWGPTSEFGSGFAQLADVFSCDSLDIDIVEKACNAFPRSKLGKAVLSYPVVRYAMQLAIKRVSDQHKDKKHDLALESITKQVKSLGARSSSLMLVAEVWCGLKSRFDKRAEEVGESFLQGRNHVVKPPM